MRVIDYPGVSLNQKIHHWFWSLYISRSGTRREELLTKPDELQMMWIIRKVVHDMDEIAAMEFLNDKLKGSKTNGEFFDSMKRQGNQ